MWDPKARMLLPGEIEHESMIQRRQSGLPIPVSLMKEIAGIAETVGFDAPELAFA